MRPTISPACAGPPTSAQDSAAAAAVAKIPEILDTISSHAGSCGGAAAGVRRLDATWFSDPSRVVLVAYGQRFRQEFKNNYIGLIILTRACVPLKAEATGKTDKRAERRRNEGGAGRFARDATRFEGGGEAQSSQFPPSFGDTASGADQAGVRVYNERLLLSLVRRFGPLSKIEVARLTGLSVQSTSAIMN